LISAPGASLSAGGPGSLLQESRAFRRNQQSAISIYEL